MVKLYTKKVDLCKDFLPIFPTMVSMKDWARRRSRLMWPGRCGEVNE
jgi:hypothetical protein